MAGLTDREAGAVLQRLDDQDKVLAAILEQTKKTNGRVQGLERWRAQVMGVMKLTGFVIPLALVILFH